MIVDAGGTAIAIDDQGPVGGEPLVMIMGLGMQLVAWPDEMVRGLVGRGFRVIRFDNRDAGLSEGFDALGLPNLGWAALRYALHLPVHAPYRLADMAADTVGVLDALGVRQAHLCGASMGGMVAQHVAAAHPQRVKSLTLMMTTTGARHLPGPSLAVRRALLQPAGPTLQARVEHVARLLALIGSPAYPAEPAALRLRVETVLRRAWRPAGVARQLAAIVADGDRSMLAARIAAPTHVIHGAADPLVPAAAARDLHGRIAGSTLEVIDGMGHDLPTPLLARFVDGIAGVAARAGC